MTTKITLASGATLEYEGDVLIGEDGTILLEAKTAADVDKNDPAHADKDASPKTEDELIAAVLSPQVKNFATLQIIDSLLNINDLHFETFEMFCESSRFRSKTWRDEHVVDEFDLSISTVRSRTSILIHAGLVRRVTRGQFSIAPGVTKILEDRYDEIIAERARRRQFVLGAFDQNRKKSD